jgi:hypothetical protein
MLSEESTSGMKVMLLARAYIMMTALLRIYIYMVSSFNSSSNIKG